MALHEQSTAAMTPQDFADTQFRWALEYNPKGFAPSPTEGFCGSTAAFSFDDVAEVLAYSEGENDESSWLAVLRLRDNRFISVVAGCDQTGWDCQSDMRSTAAASLDEIVRWGLSPEERERLGLSLAA